MGTIIVEFRRGMNARRHMVSEPRALALVNLVAKNNRRYGGYIIHVGVIIAFVGIIGSSFFPTDVQKSLHPLENITIASVLPLLPPPSQITTTHLHPPPPP